MISPPSLTPSFSLDCTDGMVQLLNVTSGANITGAVGVCVSNNYRPICYDFWDQYDAQVVCSQLNMTGCELMPLHILFMSNYISVHFTELHSANMHCIK